MKVRELMSTPTAACGPRTNAAALAEVFWAKDCGCVPIVDEKNRVIGIVTDRDTSIALGTRNKLPAHLAAHEFMTTDVATVGPDEDAKRALAIMNAKKVRRLPVVAADRTLVGMISITDFIREARAGTEIGHQAVALALQAIGSPDGTTAAAPRAAGALASATRR